MKAIFSDRPSRPGAWGALGANRHAACWALPTWLPCAELRAAAGRLGPRGTPGSARPRSFSPRAFGSRVVSMLYRCINFNGSSFDLGRATRSFVLRRSRGTLFGSLGNEARAVTAAARRLARGAACFDDATNGMGRDARARPRPARRRAAAARESGPHPRVLSGPFTPFTSLPCTVRSDRRTNEVIAHPDDRGHQ